LDIKNYEGNRLRDTAMTFWLQRQQQLVTDYSLVGYILSPNPTIMKHCADNRSTIHDDAADCHIEKLILDPLLIGIKHREKLVDLIDKLKDEYGEFTSK
jgi:hypothetical protein